MHKKHAMANNLKDKIIVVTGSSRGLGAAMVKEFENAGATVVGCSRESGVDVSREEDVNRFMDDVLKTHGRIDILVNNAGWGGNGKAPIENWSAEDYHKMMGANTDSVFYFTKKVAPVFKVQKSGLIINISSGAGKRGHGGLAAYAASKFAVMGITQSVGWEFQGTGASCIAICPGGINTDMRAGLFGKEDADRQQSPETVAKFIADIATGTIAVPNGGDIVIRNGEVGAISDPLGPQK